MSTASAALTAAVRDLYEAFPYPHYPLLARPRWQDGYLSHSGFARRLAADLRGTVAAPTTGGHAGDTTVLIGGGGEILPYVIRKWEPYGHRVVSVDLSARSLRRARLRLGTSLKATRFLRGDLDAYLAAAPDGAFTHIDAYGVLHHMPNPTGTLALLRAKLAPGGTARLMVYNATARGWICQLQRFFAVLGLSAASAADVGAARALLAEARRAPALGQRLAQMGGGTLASDARLADTFLHPRETRLGVDAWMDRMAASGLDVLGLFDRYGELDDLTNPLWHAPSTSALSERAADLRFENNLELFVTRPGGARATAMPRTWLLPYKLKAPPLLWFTFAETRGLSLPVRLRLWHAHLHWVLRGERRGVEALLRDLPTPATQRFLRLGAILPGQIADPGQRAALASALTSTMDVPQVPAAVDLATPSLVAAIRQVLAARGRDDPRHLAAALARLARAQA